MTPRDRDEVIERGRHKRILERRPGHAERDREVERAQKDDVDAVDREDRLGVLDDLFFFQERDDGQLAIRRFLEGCPIRLGVARRADRGHEPRDPAGS